MVAGGIEDGASGAEVTGGKALADGADPRLAASCVAALARAADTAPADAGVADAGVVHDVPVGGTDLGRAAATSRTSAPHVSQVPDHPRTAAPQRPQRPGGATHTMIAAIGPRIAPYADQRVTDRDRTSAR
jgi:hypothetical protein